MRRAVLDNYPIGRGVPVVNPLSRLYGDGQIRCLKGPLRGKKGRMPHPREWVAEGGTDMAYALPSARHAGGRVHAEAPLICRSGKALLPAGVMFGASRDITDIVLDAMVRHGIRSAMGLRHRPEVVRLASDEGLRVLPAGKAIVIEGENSTDTGLKPGDFVPDAVFGPQGSKAGGVMYILGRDPEDIMNKLRKLIK